MNVIIFIIILGVLIFVHELGHFFFAKLFGIRAEEFGFGYPPRALKLFNWRGTDFTLNWVPFGGFVKIFGEADEGEVLTEEGKKVSLVYKPRYQQLLVMFGGIIFNIVFAWLLFSGLYLFGVQTPVESVPQGYAITEDRLVITQVSPGGPAEESGIVIGDELKELVVGTTVIPAESLSNQQVSNIINNAGVSTQELTVVVLRDDQIQIIPVVPETGVINDRYAIGVALDQLTKVQTRNPLKAFYYGARHTSFVIVSMTQGLWQLITGGVSFDQVSGPVGIVTQVKDVQRLGFDYIIAFTALISLNLAVINAFPFPALDGGRIVVILIEAILRRRINPKVINWIHGIGFLLLIGLMLVVTTKDVINLF